MKTVFVGMSGGVDSSVSAALLKDQGYEVIGVFIRTWHPDFIKCTEEAERLDAMRVCAHLNIPFLTFDFEDIYKKEVADYMIREYKAGRTPNPDVMCNKYVKFGAFLNKAIDMGADYVATGHYAISEKNLRNSSALLHPAGGTFRRQNPIDFFLKKGVDPAKDQSYFLWTLKQEQLSKILFPVGHLKKTEVRKLAKKFKLPVAEKKDSQGICFLGMVDLKDFLKHYIKEKKGDVIIVPSEVEGESKEPKIIGHHPGAVFFTLGERHGFVITKKTPSDGAYYIVGKDIKKNILYVSQDKNYPYPTSPLVRGRRGGGLKLKNTNWIHDFPETYNLESRIYACQIRYHGELLGCKIKNIKKDTAEIVFKTPILVAPGQSVVVYDKDTCLGGGIVK